MSIYFENLKDTLKSIKDNLNDLSNYIHNIEVGITKILNFLKDIRINN